MPSSSTLDTESTTAVATMETLRPPSRRAMVASAVSGMQRFKQSWVNIMVLKGGIGLSQVRLSLFTSSPFPCPSILYPPSLLDVWATRRR